MHTVLEFYNNLQSIGARNRVRIWLSYRPARQHRLVESILRPNKSLKIPSKAADNHNSYDHFLKISLGSTIILNHTLLNRELLIILDCFD